MSYIKMSDQPIIYFDVDNTLIKHYTDNVCKEAGMLHIEFNRVQWAVWPMIKHIQLMQELRACGYQIAVWSQSGADHSERIVKLLNIEHLVDLIVSKPRFYVDDKPFEDQGIQRIFKYD